MSTVHSVVDHQYPPDGKQYLMCLCPIGVNHPPVAIIYPAVNEPGNWWVRWK